MSQDWEKDLFKQIENSSSRGSSSDDNLSLDGVDDELTQWGELILRLQDGVLEKEDFARLENWLLTDSRAMKYYTEFVTLVSELTFLLGKKNYDNSLINLSSV